MEDFHRRGNEFAVSEALGSFELDEGAVQLSLDIAFVAHEPVYGHGFAGGQEAGHVLTVGVG